MDIKIIIKIDDLIKRGATGSPSRLGELLGLSERTTYNYLKFMKEELQAPIKFSKQRGAYAYIQQGGFNFKWENL